VNCAVVLERAATGWALDAAESSKRALKYRRGPGEIIIVNHEGRGWWDATSAAKGDVFDLVQHLDPSLNFGQVRKTLRGLVGLPPIYPALQREKAAEGQQRAPAERWAERPLLTSGDPAWRYLTAVRCLPRAVLKVAARQDVIRRGSFSSAWFAYRRDGEVTHVEIRSATFRGSLRGGTKPCSALVQRTTASDAWRSSRRRSTRSAWPRWRTSAATRSTSPPAVAWGREPWRPSRPH
jgi:hypothetical protein